MTSAWTPELEQCMALSVRQPWAWLIVAGIKTGEYRRRRTNRRGTILIHASLNQSDCDRASLEEIERRCDCNLPHIEFGGIIGVVELIGCDEIRNTDGDGRRHKWHLDNARCLPFRPCRGALGFFRPDLGPQLCAAAIARRL